jgi:hypothetical protein
MTTLSSMPICCRTHHRSTTGAEIIDCRLYSAGPVGISAFAFTWQILAKTTESNRLRRENQRYEEQILNNQETVERVRRLEREINNLSQSLTLSDSLSKGFDDVLTFSTRRTAAYKKRTGLGAKDRKKSDRFHPVWQCVAAQSDSPFLQHLGRIDCPQGHTRRREFTADIPI